MYCERCGKVLPEGNNTCPACGHVQGQPNVQPQPQYQAAPQYAYQAPKKREQMKTEKMFVSIFKKISWVTLLTFILGCAATFFSFISIITSLFNGFYMMSFMSGLKDTALCGLITLLATVLLAKIDYKDE